MTKRTGMRAVERLNNRSTQRRVLRVINDHGRPCDRLQRDPVQTNRQTKCADRSDPTSTSKHDYEASYDIRDVNEAIRHIDSGTPLSGRVRRGFQSVWAALNSYRNSDSRTANTASCIEISKKEAVK